MKHIFIVNPISGNGRALNASKVIKQYLSEINIDNMMYYTDDIGKANDIASHFKQDKDTIIYSIGGDGTLNEIVNGIANSNIKLHIIPVGTGNDFYKTLIENNYDKIDLGKVNDKYFINIASLGLDAEVAKMANDLKKYNIPNKFVYYLSLLGTYITYKNIQVKIDDVLTPSTIIAICNGRYYGGGFKISPTSTLNDGKFDICQVDSLNKIKMLGLLTKLIKGTHIYDKSVSITQVNKVSIDSNINLNCNVDGEIISGKHFDFSIVNNAINLDIDDSLGINKVLKLKKIIK